MNVLRFRWWLVPIGSFVTFVRISQIIINSQLEFVKYDLKMFHFTLNRAETRSGRVGTVSNRLETGFPSQISHRSRGAVAEPIKPLEPRGAALQTCHVAQSESDACAGVLGRGAG